MASVGKIVFTAKTSPNFTKEIEESVESSPALRKAVRRVFQIANRRIQNIENAGLISPAVIALNKGNVDGFSKFSISAAGDWPNVKEEYARACAFLARKTSTASGSREYKDFIQQDLNLENDDAFFESMYHTIAQNIAEDRAADYSYWSYSDAVRAVNDSTNDEINDIESNSEEYADDIQNQINNAAQSIKNAINGSSFEIDFDD